MWRSPSGANPIENHPVAATYFKQFTKRGGKLIVMDPRGQALEAVLRRICCNSARARMCRC